VASFEELGGGERFGAVALLNVLDRCDDPMGLLTAAVRALKPDGVLLIATVLPFCSMVYEGVPGKVGAHRPPKRPLRLPPSLRCRMVTMGKAGDRYLGINEDGLDRQAFGEHLAGFVAATVGTLPLRVAAWTRVPYLASGTTEHTYYHLDNALLVLRHT
jgi:SAM-dependent methyltransferase